MTRCKPFLRSASYSGRLATVVLVLAAFWPAVAAAEGLHERTLPVVADAALGTIEAVLISPDGAPLDAYAGARVEVVARFDPPVSKQAPSSPLRQLDRRADTPEVVLELDLSGLVKPTGATGFEIAVTGGGSRKPLSWLVVNHYFAGGNRIGIEAVTRCHSSYLWTYWATWTNLIWNQSNCPPHGFQLNQPGSTSQIQTQFDGAFLTRYRTWIDQDSTTWTFIPGPGGF